MLGKTGKAIKAAAQTMVQEGKAIMRGGGGRKAAVAGALLIAGGTAASASGADSADVASKTAAAIVPEFSKEVMAGKDYKTALVDGRKWDALQFLDVGIGGPSYRRSV